MDVRNAGTGMAEAMTTRTHSAVKNNGNGRLKRLNKAAFKQVDERADEIVTALVKSALEGHVLSTRLLIELAGCGVDIEKFLPKGPLQTLAMRLAREPQMPIASAEKDVETD